MSDARTIVGEEAGQRCACWACAHDQEIGFDNVIAIGIGRRVSSRVHIGVYCSLMLAPGSNFGIVTTKAILMLLEQ